MDKSEIKILLKQWCSEKVKISDNDKRKIYFQEMEIWWVHIRQNIGYEIYGKGVKFARPVIIIRKINSKSFIGIPITSQNKTGSWYFNLTINNIKCSAVLPQIRIFGHERLQRRISSVSDPMFYGLKKKLKIYLELP